MGLNDFRSSRKLALTLLRQLSGLLTFLEQVAHAIFLLVATLREAALRIVPLGDRILPLGGQGFDLSEIFLREPLDFRGGLLPEGPLHLALPRQIGERGLAGLDRARVFLPERRERLVVRFAKLSGFGACVHFLLLEGRLQRLERELAFPLLVTGLRQTRRQFAALLLDLAAFAFVRGADLRQLFAHGLALGLERFLLLRRRRVFLKFTLQVIHLCERLIVRIDDGTMPRFQRRNFFRARLRLRAESAEGFAAALHLQSRRGEFPIRGRHLRSEFRVLLERQVALLLRVGQCRLQLLDSQPRLLRAVAIAVVAARRILRIDQADLQASFRAEPDRFSREDRLGTFHQAVAQVSAIGAVEIADDEEIVRDGELRVFARDAEAVQENIAGHVATDDVFAGVNEVMGESTRTLSDNDFGLFEHSDSSCWRRISP